MTAANLPDLATIQARADAATEGPWKARRGGDFQSIQLHTGSLWIDVVDGSHQAPPLGQWVDSPDIDFIEAARTDVPALLALVQEQQARIERVEQLHYEGVAYPDDVPEGGDEVVPEAYEHHYCNEDGENWPCMTIAALTATEGA